jgi:hypothetical protein
MRENLRAEPRPFDSLRVALSIVEGRVPSPEPRAGFAGRVTS